MIDQEALQAKISEKYPQIFVGDIDSFPQLELILGIMSTNGESTLRLFKHYAFKPYLLDKYCQELLAKHADYEAKAA